MTAATAQRPQVKNDRLEKAPEDRETFHWYAMSFDITGILEAIAAKTLKPTKEVLEAAFIEGYAKSILGVNKSLSSDVDQQGSVFVGISTHRARELHADKVASPVILAYAGKKKGVLNTGSGTPDYLLIDGNHRMARAYLEGTASVEAYVLSQAQTRAFKM